MVSDTAARARDDVPAGLLPTSDLPDGLDQGAIATALAAATKGAGRLPGVKRRQRIFTRAARALLQDGTHLREAVHLTEAAGPNLKDRAPLADIRCRALNQLGQNDLVNDEITRLIGIARNRKPLAEVLRKLIVTKVTPRPSEIGLYHEFVWGEWPQDLVEFFNSERFSAQDHGVATALADNIRAARKDDPMPRADFLRKLNWGRRVHEYLKFIQRGKHRIAACATPKAYAAERAHIERLWAQRASLATSNSAPLRAAAAAGKSIVIVEAHTGVRIVAGLNLQSLGLPLSTIANGASERSSGKTFDLSPIKPGSQMRFLKLAKLMKREQRVIRIFPDGDCGEAQEFDLCGRPVRLGLGAAHLAWQGKGAVFFTAVHWTGERFQIELLPGPDAGQYETREAFDEAFYRFYLDRLAGILQGPPESMAPASGFWRFFR